MDFDPLDIEIIEYLFDNAENHVGAFDQIVFLWVCKWKLSGKLLERISLQYSH